MATIISGVEVLNMLVMTVAVSFIFRAAFGLQKEYPFWKGMSYAAMVSAPAVILHEFGHKFVAMGFGLGATFSIALFWLALGVLLVLIKSPFIFFVPAFVSIVGQATPLQNALISVAGPAVNLLLYLLAIVVQKYAKLSHKSFVFWTLTRKINGFLAIFNMIPFPPFDGYGFFSSILTVLLH